MEEKFDRKGNSYLDVKYFDYDAKYFSEIHYLNSRTGLKRFDVNFFRSHKKRPELETTIRNVKDVLNLQSQLRMPKFIIARKQDKYWKITEKIFSEELS